MNFFTDINKNLEALGQYMKTSTDCKLRRVLSGTTECAVVFIESTVNQQMLQDSIFTLLMEVAVRTGDLNAARRSATAGAHLSVVKSLSDCPAQLASGLTLIFIDGIAGALAVDIRLYPTRPAQEPNLDKTLIGARDGFNESVMSNLALVRKRLCTPQLHVCTVFVGEGNLKCFLLYMPKKNPNAKSLAENIEKRLGKLKDKLCLTFGDIIPTLAGKQLFPTYKLTERPDTVCSLIDKGKVVMLMEGQPMALCLPTSVFELMESPNDASLPTPLAIASTALRYVGAMLCLVLPGLYVSLLTYNRVLLPPELTSLVIQSESRIALALPFQILLTWMLVSLIFQVGMSLPSTLGGTIGIFGSIVLGQSLINSQIASEITLLVVITAVVGSYSVPNYPLSTALRPASLFVLGLSSFLGLTGMALGLLAVLARLLCLTSCGKPFLPLKRKKPYSEAIERLEKLADMENFNE